MTKQNVVISPLATVTLSDGSVHYLSRGAIIPKGVSKENVAHLIAVGVVAEEDVLEVEQTTEGVKDASKVNETDVVIPDGEPTLDWKVDALKAWAVRENVELPSSAKTKPEILDVFASARENEPATPAEPQS